MKYFMSFFTYSYLKGKYRDYQNKKQHLYESSEEPRWVTDYEGEMQTKFSLFWQYLEIGNDFFFWVIIKLSVN